MQKSSKKFLIFNIDWNGIYPKFGLCNSPRWVLFFKKQVVDPRDVRIFFHMVKAIVRLNNSSSFLDIYQILFVSLIYLLNL